VEVDAGLVCGESVFDVGVLDGLLAGVDDAGGRTQLPSRSRPRGHLTECEGDGDGDGDGDEGGEVGWVLVTAGEFGEVAGSEVDGGGADTLSTVWMGVALLLRGGLDDEGAFVCGGSDDDGTSVVGELVGEV
jgi:hypothetical protein